MVLVPLRLPQALLIAMGGYGAGSMRTNLTHEASVLKRGNARELDLCTLQSRSSLDSPTVRHGKSGTDNSNRTSAISAPIARHAVKAPD